MEQEKLHEAKLTLVQDKERFDKILSDSDKMAKNITKEVKERALEKSKLQKQIEELQIIITQKENKCKRYEDDLVLFKQSKHFLDVLAIQAGLKPFRPGGNDFDPETAETTKADQMVKANVRGGVTFMTEGKPVAAD